MRYKAVTSPFALSWTHWLVVSNNWAHTACRIAIEAQVGSNQPEPVGLTFDGQRLKLAKTPGTITCAECRAMRIGV